MVDPRTLISDKLRLFVDEGRIGEMMTTVANIEKILFEVNGFEFGEACRRGNLRKARSIVRQLNQFRSSTARIMFVEPPDFAELSRVPDVLADLDTGRRPADEAINAVRSAAGVVGEFVWDSFQNLHHEVYGDDDPGQRRGSAPARPDAPVDDGFDEGVTAAVREPGQGTSGEPAGPETRTPRRRRSRPDY
jgi:hypothetical protein